MHYLIVSTYFKQRVPSPNTYALKRLANSLTRKGGGEMFMDKRGSRLLDAFRVSINKRTRYDTKLSGLTAAEAEQQLLLRWDAVPFEVSIFEAIMASSSSSSAAAAAGSTAGSAQ
eukprot:1474266-Pleurochrysis_carterae.AAC.4